MDYLLSLSRNPATKSVVKSLGLPVTLPPVLSRPEGARAQRLLNDVEFAVGAVRATDVTRELGKHLAPMGARVVWTGAAEHLDLFSGAAQAWAEPVRVVPLPAQNESSSEPAGSSGATAPSGGPEEMRRVYGLVFDATGLRTRRELDVLFTFFSTWLGALTSGGRVIVLATPPDTSAQVVGSERAAEVAGLWQGIEGFVRSLGKELGRKGSTANLIWVVPGAEDGIAGPLRFFASGYSSFVTCQPLRIGASAISNRFTYEAPLQGKVALVTGAARGIGKATVESLSREGAKIAMVEHPSAAGEASLVARQLGAKLLSCDLASPTAADEISRWVGAELGGLDIVVHNAGLTRDKTLARMPRSAWDAVIDVNLEAVLRSTDVLLRNAQIRDHGRIVVLSSVGGIAGNVGQTNYALTKASLIGWVQTLAHQLASRGVTVNAVAPGFIETQMTAQMPTMIKEFARRLSALNQGGLPQDVASAVTFFALPENFGVTGSVLRVCGGALIGA